MLQNYIFINNNIKKLNKFFYDYYQILYSNFQLIKKKIKKNEFFFIFFL